jgi:hypothetical protein
MSCELINHRIVRSPSVADRRFSVVADFVDGDHEPFGVTVLGSLTEFEAGWVVSNPSYLKERETFMIDRNICHRFAVEAKNSKLEA